MESTDRPRSLQISARYHTLPYNFSNSRTAASSITFLKWPLVYKQSNLPCCPRWCFFACFPCLWRYTLTVALSSLHQKIVIGSVHLTEALQGLRMQWSCRGTGKKQQQGWWARNLTKLNDHHVITTYYVYFLLCCLVFWSFSCLGSLYWAIRTSARTLGLYRGCFLDSDNFGPLEKLILWSGRFWKW